MALRPVAGDFAYLLFGVGIIGAGLLAVPVLAGSAAHAASEAAGWKGSLKLEGRLDQDEGRGFYGVIAAATPGGVILCLTSMDPVRELFWPVVLNGIIAVPIMAVMLLLLACDPGVMGPNLIGPRLRAGLAGDRRHGCDGGGDVLDFLKVVRTTS